MEIEKFENQAVDYLKLVGISLNSQEGKYFLEVCKFFKLNPFLKEVHAIKYNTKNGTQVNIVVSYHVYLRIVTQFPEYKGVEYSYGADEYSEYCDVVVHREGRVPFKHRCYAKEWLTKEGIQKTSPRFMLMKIALSQALRLAFPEVFQFTIYTDAEIQHDPKKAENVEDTEDDVMLEIINDDTGDIISVDIDNFLKIWKNTKYKEIMPKIKDKEVSNSLNDNEKKFFKRYWREIKKLI